MKLAVISYKLRTSRTFPTLFLGRRKENRSSLEGERVAPIVERHCSCITRREELTSELLRLSARCRQIVYCRETCDARRRIRKKCRRAWREKIESSPLSDCNYSVVKSIGELKPRRNFDKMEGKKGSGVVYRKIALSILSDVKEITGGMVSFFF